MLSKIAKDRLEELREDGITLTDEEIVRINDLSRKLETCDDFQYSVPARVCQLGRFFVHEPTLCSLHWLALRETMCIDENEHWLLLLFSCVHALEPDFLFSLVDVKSIRKELTRFAKQLHCTKAQAGAAMAWLLRGDDAEEEAIEPTKSQLEKMRRDHEELMRRIGVDTWVRIADASTLNIMQLAEATRVPVRQTMTRDQLLNAILLAREQDEKENGTPGRYSVNYGRALAALNRAIIDIRVKHTKEKEAENG